MDSRESMQESRLYESLALTEQQDVYDRAARDYLDRLREMTPAQAAAHFKKLEWIENWQPEPSTRCPKCGDIVLELKWSEEHTSWQCLEPTCRNQWEWRRR